MYREYFGLKENPFSIAPDPHYFFVSEGHREALAHLVYGINSDGGFILLTGEVGTGKTTVCRCLLEQMPEDTDIAFILNPKLTVDELLATICDEFRIAYPEGTASNKVFVSRIYDFLLENHEKGRRAILIVEEAQNLTVELLEQIRLLTNLETSQRKLLQIIMLGQPELRAMLARPELRQLSQRITARYHLGPLTKKEVPAYVRHRLTVAGLTRGKPFPEPVLSLLYRLTKGVPRLINIICDRALTGAFAQDKEQVDRKTLLKAAREVSGDDRSWGSAIRAYGKVGAVVAALLVIMGAGVYYSRTPHGNTSAPPKTQAREAGIVEAQSPKTIETKPSAVAKPEGVTEADARRAAYQALFKIWQTAYDPMDSRPPCEQAAAQGLQCLEDWGNLSSLRRLNKPAMLKLRDGSDGHEYDAVITALKGDAATLAVGSETRSVDLNELSSRWSGQYLILWRTPPGYNGKLRKGSKGPMVTWLDGQLATLQGRKADPARQPLYDKEIEKQVRQFQAQAGLAPDGVAGARTIICLTDAARTGGPSLGERRGRN